MKFYNTNLMVICIIKITVLNEIWLYFAKKRILRLSDKSEFKYTIYTQNSCMG